MLFPRIINKMFYLCMIFIIMKIIITESKLEKAAIKWLNDNYGYLEPFETEKYPDYIFYKKGDDVILDYDKKFGYVYVNYEEIWSFFERMFGMDNQQIKDITKIWVEERYNLMVTTTNKWLLKKELRWGNATN